jgi:hypothetical protein
MNCVYVDTEVMGEEVVMVLIVRLKECGRSELREGDMAAVGSSGTSEFTCRTDLCQGQKSAV